MGNSFNSQKDLLEWMRRLKCILLPLYLMNEKTKVVFYGLFIQTQGKRILKDVREEERLMRLCWGSLGGSLTLANLGNDYDISNEYISISIRHFGEAQSKVMRAYAQSGQYHTIVEGCDS